MADKILGNVPGMKDAAEVQALNAENLSERIFSCDFVANSLPCVIRGGIKHWTACKKWRDKEYLKRCCGQRDVTLYQSEYHITARRIEHKARDVTFAEAIDYLHSEQTERGIVPDELPSELLPDLGGLSFLSKAEPAFWYVPARYFFYRNAGTAWHYHPFDETLTCQVIGSKRIGLVSSDPPFNSALRDIFFAEDYYDDSAAFAAFDSRGLRWFSATLEEGDALYIPPLWWHGVAPLTTSFGATAAVTWRSPLPVIAKGITRMARGEIDMLGKTIAPHFDALAKVALELGLQRELAIAWQRGV